MAAKTKRTALSETLEDLSVGDFEKFCHQLLDRRNEPRVRRIKVEGRSRLDVADVLVSTFTEDGAVEVAAEILRQIDCLSGAASLGEYLGAGTGSCRRPVEETTAQSSNPARSDTAGPSAGATGVNTKVVGSCTGKDFVDKHKIELIKRVSNLAPILDDLLDQGIIQQESYDKIRALPTSQEKMRELYSGPLKAGDKCKDGFYESLENNEKYLIDDLKNKK